MPRTVHRPLFSQRVSSKALLVSAAVALLTACATESAPASDDVQDVTAQPDIRDLRVASQTLGLGSETCAPLDHLDTYFSFEDAEVILSEVNFVSGANSGVALGGGGKHGYGADFDGTASFSMHHVVAPGAFESGGGLSVGFFVKVDTLPVSSAQLVESRLGDATERGWSLELTSSGSLRWTSTYDASSDDAFVLETTQGLPIGMVFHVAFTMDATSGDARFWVNGESIAFTETPGTGVSGGFPGNNDPHPGSTDIVVGAGFDGILDEFFIASYALDPVEVVNLVDGGTSTNVLACGSCGNRCGTGSICDAGTCVVRACGTSFGHAWSFDEGDGAVAGNSAWREAWVGIPDWTTVAAPASPGDGPPAGFAARFDDDVAGAILSDPSSTHEGNFAAWVRPNSSATGDRVILGNMDAGVGWEFRLTAAHGLAFEVRADGSNQLLIEGPASNVPVNTWSHVAVTYDGTGLAAGARLFVNGVQLTTTDTVIGTPDGHLSFDDARLGGTDTGVGFDGEIDELLVMDAAVGTGGIAALAVSELHACAPSSELDCDDGGAQYASCDGKTFTGCETDLSTSASDCGTCGRACSGCEAGVCTLDAEVCDNSIDDDSDGLVDCADPLCTTSPLCVDWEAHCDDGVDNDGNGFTDCDDTQCVGVGSCPASVETNCLDGFDDDDDGVLDCLDSDCASAPGCPADPNPEICGIRGDENGNGYADCADPACSSYWICESGAETECDDHVDNDGDGYIDCTDADCASALHCGGGAEDCANYSDDDGDGVIDCDDLDCNTDPACDNSSATATTGESCTSAASCVVAGQGGPACIPESFSGVPGGHCTEWCRLEGESGCPTGQQCVALKPDWEQRGLCVDRCLDGDDCASYTDDRQCRRLGVGDEAVLVCRRQCDVDADCPATGQCETAYGSCRSQIEICDDGVDNDGNDAADCADDACVGTEHCPPSSEVGLCQDGLNNDGDMDGADCADPDCSYAWSCTGANHETWCGDGVDNDGDGYTDCADDECDTDPLCPGCGSTIDCEDPGCESHPACDVTDEAQCFAGGCCTNTVDDDGDDLDDCEDPDCMGVDPSCPWQEWSCTDGDDNDGDLLMDCLDDECASDPECTSGAGAMLAWCDAHDECDGGDGEPYCMPLGAGSGLDGQCLHSCDLTDSSTCETGFDCVDLGLPDDVGMCMPGCLDSSDCVGTEQCEQFLEFSFGVCVPGCTTDTDCPWGGVCNTVSGACTPPPVATEDDCWGGQNCCSDGIDHDIDGDIDCEDVDCAGVGACPVEVCWNGADDDGDGPPDCFDSDCASRPYCIQQALPNTLPPGVACDRTSDCSAEFGTPFCADMGLPFDGTCTRSCTTEDAICDETVGVVCTDVAGDGSRLFCLPGLYPEVCDDAFDSDGDGDVDCFDSDCASDPVCTGSGDVPLGQECDVHDDCAAPAGSTPYCIPGVGDAPGACSHSCDLPTIGCGQGYQCEEAAVSSGASLCVASVCEDDCDITDVCGGPADKATGICRRGPMSTGAVPFGSDGPYDGLEDGWMLLEEFYYERSSLTISGSGLAERYDGIETLIGTGWDTEAAPCGAPPHTIEPHEGIVCTDVVLVVPEDAPALRDLYLEVHDTDPVAELAGREAYSAMHPWSTAAPASEIPSASGNGPFGADGLWSYGDIQPGEQRRVSLQFRNPPGAHAYETVVGPSFNTPVAGRTFRVYGRISEICDDGVDNDGDGDTDECGVVAAGEECFANTECAEGLICQSRTCSPTSCVNGVLDSGEERVDCGGPCAACDSCANGELDLGETDIDCGGSCGPCSVGESCGDDGDCGAGSMCFEGVCAPEDCVVEGTPRTLATACADVPDPPGPPTCDVDKDDEVEDDASHMSCAFEERIAHIVETLDDPAAIAHADGERVAIIRGLVLDRQGLPIPGVTVTARPQRSDLPGTTATDIVAYTGFDGVFTLVVEGGAATLLTYSVEGYLDVQRSVRPDWNQIAWADDVVMTPRAAAIAPESGATTITETQRFAATNTPGHLEETARGILLWFHPSTTVRPAAGGTGRAEFDVHVTEFTDGPLGLEAMPGALPPETAYTFAAEFEVAVASEIAAGDPVVFDNGLPGETPAVAYVTNFLGAPVGSVVPSGYYDRELGVWVAEPNGVVLRILAGTGNERIDMDGDSDYDTDDEALIAAAGISETEAAALQGRLSATTVLWRVPLTHFSPHDFNGPIPFEPDRPSPINPGPPDDDDDPQCRVGSIIECENQVLGETIPLAGTPFALHYRSDRVRGRQSARTLSVSLRGLDEFGVRVESGALTIPEVSEKLDSGEWRLEVQAAGQRWRATGADLTEDGVVEYVWDGLDAWGYPMSAGTPVLARFSVRYEPGVLFPDCLVTRGFGVIPFEIECSFSEGSVVSRPYGYAWATTEWRGRLEAVNADRLAGWGGWTLSAQHLLEPNSRRVHLGDGNRIRRPEDEGTLPREVSAFPMSNQDVDSADEAPLREIDTDGMGNLYVWHDTPAAWTHCTNGRAGVLLGRGIRRRRPEGCTDDIGATCTGTGCDPEASTFCLARNGTPSAIDISLASPLAHPDQLAGHAVNEQSGAGGTNDCDAIYTASTGGAEPGGPANPQEIAGVRGLPLNPSVALMALNVWKPEFTTGGAYIGADRSQPSTARFVALPVDADLAGGSPPSGGSVAAITSSYDTDSDGVDDITGALHNMLGFAAERVSVAFNASDELISVGGVLYVASRTAAGNIQMFSLEPTRSPETNRHREALVAGPASCSTPSASGGSDPDEVAADELCVFGDLIGMSAQADGTLHVMVSDDGHGTIWVIRPDGTAVRAAGGPPERDLPVEGQWAREVRIVDPVAFEVVPSYGMDEVMTTAGPTSVQDFGYFVAEGDAERIRRIRGWGTIETFAGCAYEYDALADEYVCGDVAEMDVSDVVDIAASEDGELYVAFDVAAGLARPIWQLRFERERQFSQLPGVPFDQLAFPSDAGDELFLFNYMGQHVATHDVLTGRQTMELGYEDGLINFVRSNPTFNYAGRETFEIDRSTPGEISITWEPFGTSVEREIVLELADDGPDQTLVGVTLDDGREYRMEYAAGGLMTRFEDARGVVSEMRYGSDGRLLRDTRIVGSPDGDTLVDDVSTTLERHIDWEGNSVTVLDTTTEGRIRGSTTEWLPDGTEIRERGWVESVTGGVPNYFSDSETIVRGRHASVRTSADGLVQSSSRTAASVRMFSTSGFVGSYPMDGFFNSTSVLVVSIGGESVQRSIASSRDFIDDVNDLHDLSLLEPLRNTESRSIDGGSGRFASGMVDYERMSSTEEEVRYLFGGNTAGQVQVQLTDGLPRFITQDATGDDLDTFRVDWTDDRVSAWGFADGDAPGVPFRSSVQVESRDDDGRVIAWSAPRSASTGRTETDVERDAAGRVVSTVRHAGGTTGHRLSREVDEDGRTTSLQVAREETLSGGVWSDSPGVEHEMHYDESGLLDEYSPPDVLASEGSGAAAPTGDLEYHFDADRVLQSIGYPDGSTRTYTTVPGRMERLAETEARPSGYTSSRAYAYDEAFRLARVVAASSEFGVANVETSCNPITPGEPPCSSLDFEWFGPLLARVAWGGAVEAAIEYAYGDGLLPEEVTITDSQPTTQAYASLGYEYDSSTSLGLSPIAVGPSWASTPYFFGDLAYIRTDANPANPRRTTLESRDLTTVRELDSQLRLEREHTTDESDTTVFDAHYGYYPDGKIAWMVELVPGLSATAPTQVLWCYEYGAIDRRLDVASEYDVSTHTFDYDSGPIQPCLSLPAGATLLGEYEYETDPNGNRIAVDVPARHSDALDLDTSDIWTDAQDRLRIYGDLEFAYDANGSLLAEAELETNVGRTYTYDLDGGLRDVTLIDAAGVDTVVEYDLDPMGRRVGRRETIDGVSQGSGLRWIYQDALNPVAEFEGGFWQATFVYLSSSHVPDVVIRRIPAGGYDILRVITDARGSVRLVVNAETGEVVQRIDYGPFGSWTVYGDPEVQPFGYAGGLRDDTTGLTRFGARDYDFRTGRWTAKDPILWGGGQANLYEYVGGDPVNGVDPTGLHPCDDQAGDYDQQECWDLLCEEPDLSDGLERYCDPNAPESDPHSCSMLWQADRVRDIQTWRRAPGNAAFSFVKNAAWGILQTVFGATRPGAPLREHIDRDDDFDDLPTVND